MQPVVVIGGGLAGMAAAWRLAEHGHRVLLVEALDRLGGVARSFEHQGRRYPLGYHHILPGDDGLRAALVRLGLWQRVRWRSQRMHFLVHGRLHSLGDPLGLARFPLGRREKLGLGRVLAGALLGPEPHPDLDAERWLLRHLDDTAALRFFVDLCELRYGRHLSELSARWLRARIRARESAGRLGFIPGTDWTWQLTRSLEQRLHGLGVALRLGTRVTGLVRGPRERVLAVHLDSGEQVAVRAVISTVPPPVLLSLAPELPDPVLRGIHYSAVVSWVLATPDPAGPDTYWTNALRPRLSFGGLFRLDRLNPSLGRAGLRLLNFAAHVMPRRDDPVWGRSDAQAQQAFLDDYAQAFGRPPRIAWSRLTRIPAYAPVAVAGYRNPALRSPWPGLYLAGNFRTFPAVPTTGTALDSGIETAQAVHRDLASRGTHLHLVTQSA